MLLTSALGLVGGVVGWRLGLPAPALLGSVLAVTAASLAGLPVAFPERLRDLAFATVGSSLGAGLTPAFLSDLARWPISLAALCLTMLAIMAVSARLLTWGFGFGRTEALLGTSPGALSYAIALGVSGGHDMAPILVLQSLRLLLITLSLPLLLTGLGVEGAMQGEGQVTAPIALSLLVILGAWGLGRVAAGFGVPAAFFLAGILLSGGLHVSELVQGRMPLPVVFVGFVMIGCVIGARFAVIPPGALGRYWSASVVVVVAATALAALSALGVARSLGLPFGQVWVAFAPGGVEAMAAMALSLGYDPAFVATHHLVRILFLILVLPIIVRMAGKRGG